MTRLTEVPPGFMEFHEANKGLIFKVSAKIYKRVLAAGHAVEFADIEQEARISMMKTFAGFDPSKGFRFSTYFMRAAFNDLNRFLDNHEHGAPLGTVSMQALSTEEGEAVDLESLIDGGHANPEQMLEAKQMLQSIEEVLSPLAMVLLELTMEPTEAMEQEWERITEIEHAQRAVPMSEAFINKYVSKATGATEGEIKRARREIRSLAETLNV
jgi:RNA polymerase sigma factor (sigma-70 family)